jgi:hypothetical protein
MLKNPIAKDIVKNSGIRKLINIPMKTVETALT